MMTDPARILVIEQNTCNLDLLRALLIQEGYLVVEATTLEKADQILEGDDINLALVDIEGFDYRVWERCEIMRRRGIPLLVVFSGTDNYQREESLRHGAQVVLAKPLITQELICMLNNFLEGHA